jgi:protein disulfide-isomerase A6
MVLSLSRCGYCKALAPQYHLLAETYGEEDDILLAEVNGPENPALASEFLVSGFPTILFFPKGSNHPTPYTDDKTLEAMTQWMNDKLGVERFVPLPKSAALDLDKNNFAEFINDNPHGAVVLFYSRGECPSGNCMVSRGGPPLSLMSVSHRAWFTNWNC